MQMKSKIRLNFGQVCPLPHNVSVSSIEMHSATINWDANSQVSSWVVEYATSSDFSGATSTTVTTNSCSLSGLTYGTTYYVRVKATCGAGNESGWNGLSFKTLYCPATEQCTISYELHSSDIYNHGWYSCAIHIMDPTTNTILKTVTVENGVSTVSGSLSVCNNRIVMFSWVNCVHPEYASYTFYDPSGNVIFSGSGAFDDAIFYTPLCSSSSS